MIIIRWFNYAILNVVGLLNMYKKKRCKISCTVSFLINCILAKEMDTKSKNYYFSSKMMNPYKSWTDITYENGYFDQAHFIKEVKTFSSKTPDELFKYTPPPTENFIGKVEY